MEIRSRGWVAFVTAAVAAGCGGSAVDEPMATQSAASSGGAHAPIVIQSDADFTNCGCVLGGNGTASSPYVIGPWSINNASGTGVLIDGTHLTKSFDLYDLTIAGNAAATAVGIEIDNVNASGTQSIVAQVTGTATSIQTSAIGIRVQHSSWVTLDGGGAASSGPGIVASGKAGTVNKNSIGAIDLENDSHVTVRGWHMSTNGPSIQPDWVTLDPSVSIWSVGGVRLFGTSASTVDHNSANNCTNVSYSLFASNGNTVSNNAADYPFTMNYLVTDGSSYNVLTGNEGSTGDFIGLMIADPLPGSWTLTQYGPSHDNQVVGNTIHSDGPTGTEIANGVCPAFLGGIVLLNGTYDNVVENNQTWGSSGADIAWAQAVPSSSSPVGVLSYKPALHCNVTDSEGGGGVANLNGNVWKGNTYKTIDPCLPAQ